MRDTDAGAAARLGITLAVTSYPGRRGAAAADYRKAGVSIIDNTLKLIVYRHVPQSCRMSTGACPLQPDELKAISAEVDKHLAQVGNDPAVAGFYILDDYPGVIPAVLNRVHDLVSDSNKRERFDRPTVCGFTANLDFTVGNALVQVRDAIEQALLNYSPTACDAVLLYSYAYRYGYAGPLSGTDFDWKMAKLLPDVLNALRRRGWTPRTPLIATPMAFYLPAEGFIPPTGDELNTQIRAFCAAGADALVIYAWRVERPPGAFDLRTDPSLRKSLTTGSTVCRARWRSSSPSTARVRSPQR